MRSTPEWAASESMPSEPVIRPTTSLSVVITLAAATERNAAERFSAPALETGFWVTTWLIATFSLHLAEPRGLAFDAAIQSGDSEAVRGPGYLREAGPAHQVHHLGRRRKTLHRGWQVSVGAAHAR